MTRFIVIKEWIGSDAAPQKKIILQTIKLIILVGLFIGLFWMIPIQNVVQVIASADLILLSIGLLLGLPMIYINSFELGILTRKHGVIIPTSKLFAINMVVKFYQLFLPGAIIGSGIRWMKISPKGKSIETLTAMAFYRLLDLFLVISIGVFWFATGVSQLEINAWVIAGYFFGVVVLWLALTKGSLRIAIWLEQKPFGPSKRPAFQVTRGYLERLIKSLAVFSDLTGKELAMLVSAGILSDIVSLISYVFIARSIGIDISVANLGWMRSVFLLASLSPFTIAGGLGIREVSFVLMMSTFDIRSEAALAFSLLIFCRTLFLSIIGGIIDLVDTISSRIKISKV